MENKYCIVDSLYSLVIYFLITNDDIKKTIFVVSEGIPSEIRNKLPNKIYLKSYNKSKTRVLLTFLTSLKIIFTKFYWKLIFDKNRKIYGQDHLFYSFLFVRFKMDLIEDGLGNYVLPKKSLINKIKMFLNGGEIFGRSKKIKNIYLTMLSNIPENIQNKVIALDFKKLWTDFKFKNEFFELIGAKKSDFECNAQVLILTQPFSEDRAISESEKIEIYKNIASNYKGKIAIKAHPRETTKYETYMPDCYIFNKNIPSQILFLFYRPKIIASCFSTGIYAKDKEIQIDKYGTMNSKKLIEKYGEILGNRNDF